MLGGATMLPASAHQTHKPKAHHTSLHSLKPGVSFATAPCTNNPSNPACVDTSGPHGWSLATQNKLTPFIDKISAIVDDTRGYADLRAEYKPPGIAILFHGELPDAVDKIIDKAAEAHIIIRQVHIANYPKTMYHAASVLANALNTDHVNWTSVRPNNMYSKLILGLPRASMNKDSYKQISIIAKDAIPHIALTFTREAHSHLLGRSRT
jgi:hypothetical protein